MRECDRLWLAGYCVACTDFSEHRLTLAGIADLIYGEVRRVWRSGHSYGYWRGYVDAVLDSVGC